MSRRLLIGNAGAGFKIRQVLPGFDAASPSLNGVVFDSDNLPMRIVGSGEFDLAAVDPIEGRDFSVDIIAVANVPHSLGYIPFVAAIAWCAQWSYAQQKPNPIDATRAVWGRKVLGVPNMDGNYVTPYVLQGSTGGSTVYSFHGGWDVRPSTTNIRFRNQTCDSLHIKYTLYDPR